jgi:hypothetical protein
MEIVESFALGVSPCLMGPYYSDVETMRTLAGSDADALAGCSLSTLTALHHIITAAIDVEGVKNKSITELMQADVHF